MEKIEIKTPAKINLGLNITGKRPDGYHNLETIFYPVNIYDVISIEKAETTSISSNNASLVKEEGNSIIKAVNILENETGKKLSVKIFLEKNIPIGAGMGGGTSDGAAVLLALNDLYDLGMDKNRLRELALQIGSDAPYFINPVPCFARSRGEELSEINFNIPFPILIINPGIHISTKWAYQNIPQSLTHKSIGPLTDFNGLSINELKNILTNDFEAVVFPAYPEIADIKNKMYESGAAFSLMTGSGSTVFGIFEDMSQAEAAKNNFPDIYFKFIS